MAAQTGYLPRCHFAVALGSRGGLHLHPQVPELVLELMSWSPNPAVVEHAASVLAVMAQNPDTHFGLVGSGAVPLVVQMLGRGEDAA